MSKAAECVTLSMDQVKLLEENFRANKHPAGTSLMLIAAEVGVSEEDAQKWFNLRNAQWRQEEGLPAEQGSVFQ